MAVSGTLAMRTVKTHNKCVINANTVKEINHFVPPWLREPGGKSGALAVQATTKKALRDVELAPNQTEGEVAEDILGETCGARHDRPG